MIEQVERFDPHRGSEAIRDSDVLTQTCVNAMHWSPYKIVFLGNVEAGPRIEMVVLSLDNA
jgi:hypothetical protein